jgi:hypothetical protein
MKTVLITFLALSLISLSCKKEDKDNKNLPYTEVYGKVVSTGSQKPVDSVRVSIWDGLPDAGPLSGGSYKGSGEYDTTFTDIKGNFHIGVHGKEPVLYLYKKGYTFVYDIEGATFGIAPLIAGKVYMDEVFNLDAVAYFNPVLMNKVQQEENDYIIVSLYGRYSVPYFENNFAGNGPFKYYPWDKYGSLVLGDSYSKYKLRYLRDGVVYIIFDSVFIKPMEIYTDTIYY